MCGTAAAASSLLTVRRTSSDPARASEATCSTVEATSAVSVLVMDCTTTGASEPTRTLPMVQLRDLRRWIEAMWNLQFNIRRSPTARSRYRIYSSAAKSAINELMKRMKKADGKSIADYEWAKRRALARLRKGFNLGFVKPESRDELHECVEN